jgi:hypothetical protein
MRKLPTFRGCTIDCHLQEFRKVPHDHSKLPEFIPFKSENGDDLVVAYLKTRAGKRALKDGSFWYNI